MFDALRAWIAGGIALAFLALLSFLPLRAGERWYPAGQAANDAALKEHKVVLQVFKRSDWAGQWSDLVATDSSAKLEREVFSTPEFQAFARKHLVLQLLDYSKDFPADDRTRQMLHQSLQYWEPQIKAYPTLLLHDGDWKELGRREGYREGQAAEVMAWLRKAARAE